MSFYGWRPYVSVAERRAKARKEMDKQRKKGKDIQPVELGGRKIAVSFWGKGWCDHLESFSDYENRLPRGRTYVRNGSVCHLEIHAGRIEALVSGSELYKIAIEIKPLARTAWDAIKAKCQGQIGSVLELLQGRLSGHVMEVVCDRNHGLFPKPGEIQLRCSCPDWATMCKHVAAVLYGVGSRLDYRPELLFVLRGVDAEELIAADITLPTGAAVAPAETLAESGLAEIFNIDMDTDLDGIPPGKTSMKPHPASGSRSKKEKRKSKASQIQPLAPGGKKSKKTSTSRKSKPVFDPTHPTGEGIARLRKLTGFSVETFAKALGVSPPSVQRWENIPGPLRLYARPLAALTRLLEENTSK